MNNKTQKMILISLFAALTAIGAFFKIPLPPVPFTLQIFFVIFAGLLLGAKAGFASQAIYIAVGLAGFPIFASGGGIQYIFKPSFGYLLGFAAGAFVVGLISEKLNVSSASITKLVEKLPAKSALFIKFLIASAAGLIVCYLIGVPYLYFMMKYVSHASVTASGIIMSGFILFLPWDIVKVMVASWLASQVYNRVNAARSQNV